jgi:hypothetical protein
LVFLPLDLMGFQAWGLNELLQSLVDESTSDFCPIPAIDSLLSEVIEQPNGLIRKSHPDDSTPSGVYSLRHNYGLIMA